MMKFILCDTDMRQTDFIVHMDHSPYILCANGDPIRVTLNKSSGNNHYEGMGLLKCDYCSIVNFLKQGSSA
jgi:hypothetical protein